MSYSTTVKYSRASPTKISVLLQIDIRSTYGPLISVMVQVCNSKRKGGSLEQNETRAYNLLTLMSQQKR